jgi:hypothetical protein
MLVGIKASLEVAGGFEIHGTVDHSRASRASTSALARGRFHFDMASLYACVRTGGQGLRRRASIENSCLRATAGSTSASLGLPAFHDAEVGMRPRSARCPEGKPPEVSFRTCWLKQTLLEGRGALMLRAAEVKGTLEVRHVDDLILDGCDFLGDVKIVQEVDDSWSRVQLLKSNLLAGAKLTLARPTGPKTKQEKVRLEKFHFEGAQGAPALSDKDVAARVVDGEDDPQVSVKAVWSKPNERRHVFLDKQLRMRAPPLR